MVRRIYLKHFRTLSPQFCFLYSPGEIQHQEWAMTMLLIPKITEVNMYIDKLLKAVSTQCLFWGEYQINHRINDARF